MNTPNTLAALAIVAGLLLAGCVPLPAGPAEPSPADPLAGTGWTLTRLGDAPARTDTQVTAIFEDGRVGGTDGCNHYTTAYTVEDGKLTVDRDAISTLTACADLIMEQAGAYMQALTQAERAVLDGEQLILADAAGNVLATFRRRSSGLAGTAWIVTGYNNGRGVVVSVIEGPELTVGFSADGRVGGSAGCNTFSAAVELAGKTVAVGPAGTTRMACQDPAGLMLQEDAFLAALASAAAYRLDGDRLELRTAEDALAVSLTRAR